MAKKKTAKKSKTPKTMKKSAKKPVKAAKKMSAKSAMKTVAKSKKATPKANLKTKKSAVKKSAKKPNVKMKSASAAKTPSKVTTPTAQLSFQQMTSQPSQTPDNNSSQEQANNQHLLGSELPELVLQDSQGHSHKLSDYKGQKVVLYFYPKDDTPGCTLEGQQFNQLHTQFQKANTLVFGVSRDSVKSHDRFKCKFGFGFELLSDESEQACKIFDVIKEKNMYGKKVIGIERSTFVIDENGKVAKEYRKVTADGHAAQVLKDISEM